VGGLEELLGGDRGAAGEDRAFNLTEATTVCCKLNGGDDKRDRMLFLGNVAYFRCYFTERRTFDGIFRISQSFDAMRPIFP
jgi:hypothetical protein